MRSAYLFCFLLVPAAGLTLTQLQKDRPAAAQTAGGTRLTQSPIDLLPPAPGRDVTLKPTPITSPYRPLPTVTPLPTSTPKPTPAPPKSQIIRVGLSTTGGPVQFYSAGPMGVSDPNQPGRRMVIPAGQTLQFVMGNVESAEVGGKTYKGPIVIQTGGAASVGWSAISLYVTAQPGRFTSNGNNPRWGRPYRGHFEVWPQRSPEPNHRKGDLTVINVVQLEEYLKGVVPWEMSPSAPMEALKAQAITARTKTLQLVRAKLFASGGFDVCDYDACQGYPGMENEKPSTTTAVEQTDGLAIFHNNRPIDAVYCTNSGGITANASDVWRATSPVPYLASVRDFSESSKTAGMLKPEMTEGDWLAFCSQPLPSYARPTDEMKTALAARRAKSAFAAKLFGPEDWPEFYRWKREFTEAEVNQAFADRGFRQVTGIEVVQRTASGRIRQLRVSGFAPAPPTAPVTAPDAPAEPLVAPTPLPPTKTLMLEGDAAVRSMLSKRLGSTTALPNSLFVVTPKTDASGRLSVWVLQGAGWGHGVGMCQRGAQNHAVEGWDARRILNWYYKGIEIRDITP